MKISDIGGAAPDQFIDNACIKTMELTSHHPDGNGDSMLELKVVYRRPTIDGEVIEDPTGTPLDGVFQAPAAGIGLPPPWKRHD